MTDQPGSLCSACLAAGDRPIAPRAQPRPPQAGVHRPRLSSLPVAGVGSRPQSTIVSRVVMFFLLLICVPLFFLAIWGYYLKFTGYFDERSDNVPTAPAGSSGSPTPPQVGSGTANPQSSNAGTPPPPDRVYVYAPLLPYPYDRSIPPASESVVYEGRAPETDDELRQFIAENPNSHIAKAQEFYVRDDGQRMWRYTETTPVQPRLEIQGFQYQQKTDGSHFEGSILVRNMGPFPVMDIEITLMTQQRAIVLVPPNHPGRVLIPASQGMQYRFSGAVGSPASLRAARLKVEAQINGPPGVVVAETAFGQ